MVAQLKMTLTVDGVPKGSSLSFTCRAVRGRDAISEPFRFDIALSGTSEEVGKFEDAQAVGKVAWLDIIVSSDGTQKYQGTYAGVILGFRRDEILDTPKAVPFTVVLGPRLALLDCSQQSAIVLNDQATVTDFFKKKLLSADADTSTTGGHRQVLTLDLSDTMNTDALPIAKSLTRYNETDLAFFSRVAEEHGIFYFFTGTRPVEKVSQPGRRKDSGSASPAPKSAAADTSPTDVLRMGARNSDFPAFSDKKLIYKNKSSGASDLLDPCVRAFSKVQRPHAGMVGVRGYNEDEAAVPLLSQSVTTSAGKGTKIEYGEFFTSAEQAKLATIRAQEVAWQAEVYEGESTIVGLRAGMLVTMDSAKSTTFGVQYIIVSIEHSAATDNVFYTELGLATNEPYRNRFLAIPESPRQFRPIRRTPRPVMAGMSSGVVAGDSKAALLDEAGKYQVRMQSDEADKDHLMDKPRAGTPAVRLMRPYANSMPDKEVSGMHFPLVPQTEVLMAYVNGDPDRPMIVGTATNNVNTNLVTSDLSPAVNRLRTVAGTLLEMGDGGGVTDTKNPPFLRLDVPSKPDEGAISGTYFRMGAAPADEVAKDGTSLVGTNLTYTPKAEKGTDPVSKKSSGKGLQFYTSDDLDLNVLGAGLMKFGKGRTEEVTMGDATHHVLDGIYTLDAGSGIAITTTKGDLVLNAANAVTQKSNGPTIDFTAGYAEKYTKGATLNYFFGMEQTLKFSSSTTIQAGGFSTLTLGFVCGFTGGAKVDVIFGKSAKLALGMGDIKVAMRDGKILEGSDLKIATADSKFLTGNDTKYAAISKTLKLMDYDKGDVETLNKNIDSMFEGIEMNDIKVSTIKSDLSVVMTGSRIKS